MAAAARHLNCVVYTTYTEVLKDANVGKLARSSPRVIDSDDATRSTCLEIVFVALRLTAHFQWYTQICATATAAGVDCTSADVRACAQKCETQNKAKKSCTLSPPLFVYSPASCQKTSFGMLQTVVGLLQGDTRAGGRQTCAREGANVRKRETNKAARIEGAREAPLPHASERRRQSAACDERRPHTQIFRATIRSFFRHSIVFVA